MNPRDIIIFFVIVNVLAYLIMHVDKNNARNGRKRISEASLLTLAFIGGSVGMLVSMFILHHKTRKKKFKYGVPVILAIQVALLLLLSK